MNTDLKQTHLASFRREVHTEHRTCQSTESHSHFPTPQAIFKATSIAYGQKYRSRAGGLKFDTSKINICPEGKAAIPYFQAKKLWREAVLHFVNEKSLSYISQCHWRRKNCEIPQNRWQKFESNERLVWSIHTLCRTLIKVSSICVKNVLLPLDRCCLTSTVTWFSWGKKPMCYLW